MHLKTKTNYATDNGRLASPPNENSGDANYFCAALTFAHRALAAAEIRARPAALILRLLFGAASAAGLVEEPKICSSSFSSDWILSLMSAARRNCWADRLAMDALMPSVRNFWPEKSTISCRSPFLLRLDPHSKIVFQSGVEFENPHSRQRRC